MMTCGKRDSLSLQKRRIYKDALVVDVGVVRSRNGHQHGASWRVERMQALDTDVHGRIFALVDAILKQNSIAAKVLPDSRLTDVGLTSMDMVNLMLGVEAEFDLTIPQSEITPDNFQSVRALERMIIGQLKPEKAA
jgi:acyl carrier protein